MPATITIYTGKATRGIGVYLVVRRVYDNNQEDLVQIYELDKAMTAWEHIYSSDYYVPTVLAFGRGISYYRAKEEANVSLSAPVKLEDENLLTRQFIAYYSTDGYSSAFELPYENLGNEAINCRYKTLSGEYSFTISPDENRSPLILVENKRIALSCNRALGIVFFVDEYNAALPLPYFEIENNLKFSAWMPPNNERINLGAMTRCIKLASTSAENEEGLVVFYRNELEDGGKINWINCKNPLYFPKGATATPGDIKNKLKGGFLFNNMLCVFDNEMLYTANVTSAKDFDLSFVIKGFSSTKDVSYDKITFNKAIKLPQEPIEKTVEVLTDRVLFSGKQGGVYEIKSGSLSNIERVADLSPLGFNAKFSLIYKGGYLLFNEKEACYYHPLKKSLFLWEIISTTVAGLSLSDECCLIACTQDDDGDTIINPLIFDYDEDSVVVDFSEIPVSASKKISSKLSCDFSLEPVFKKRLYAVILETEANNSVVEVEVLCDGKSIYSKELTFDDDIKILRYGASFKGLKLKLSGENIEFKNAKLVYCDGKTY